MKTIRALLSGGDRRSIGRVHEVVARVKREPSLLDEVFQALGDGDPVVRMRAADAAEKITADSPELLQPYKGLLLGEISRVPQQEVRWHLAQMLPRLVLSPREKAAAVKILTGYLKDESRIVKTFALQGLAEISRSDPALRDGLARRIGEFLRRGSPAMKSRARKLLAELEPGRAGRREG